MQHWNYADKAKLIQETKQKLTMTLSLDTTCQLSTLKHHHKYINNLTGPIIMENVEPKVQRHVKTQLENSTLVCILLWSRENDKVM